MLTKYISAKKRSYYYGLFSEYIAMFLLLLKGYAILEHRYKTKIGEIDIIAKKGKYIIFIEVKARKTKEQGLNAITPNQRRRINKTALLFDAKNKKYSGLGRRFDLIVIAGFTAPYHLKNIFM